MVGDYSDIPRVYTALAEWMVCFCFCLIMPRKLTGMKFYLYSAAVLVFLTVWLILTGNVSIFLWIPCMLVAIWIMFDYLVNVIDEDLSSVLFLTAKAFLIAEFIASMEWEIEYFYTVNTQFDRAGVIVLLLVYGFAFFVLFQLESHLSRSYSGLKISRKEILMVILITILSFAVSNMNFIYTGTPFSTRIVTDIFMMRTLVDLVGVAILYAYQIRLSELNTERELENLNAMLKTQYDHYRNYQQNVDLINFKYHDLKHQIAGLRAEMNPEKRNRWLEDLEEELESYRPETQTGNQVLDGVLDAKMTMIRNNKVEFTCVADGALLNFMHVTDICTIFGNALDNALENVVTVEDPEKRMIHMSVSAKKQFLFITVQNYCDHEVSFVKGTPVTTKTDSASHGFGTKSIAYTAKKYGGNVSYSLKNSIFTMNLLIPMTER